MITNAVSRCGQCRAMVNVHWRVCLACRAPLEMEAVEQGTAATPASDWLSQWQNLAKVAGMISEEDPRYDPILTALGTCDSAYKAGDQPRFTKEAEHVMRVAAFVPGAVIQWRGHDKKLMGPAAVSEMVYEDGRLWVCVKWKGQLYWVSESIIERITVDGKTTPSPAVRRF